MDSKPFSFLPIHKALGFTGHETTKGFSEWVRKHNRSFPGNPIIRRHGMIDVLTLKAALVMRSQRSTYLVSGKANTYSNDCLEDVRNGHERVNEGQTLDSESSSKILRSSHMEDQTFDFRSVKEALTITGHKSVNAFSRWVRYNNRHHSEQLIIRRFGMVDIISLKKALRDRSSIDGK